MATSEAEDCPFAPQAGAGGYVCGTRTCWPKVALQVTADGAWLSPMTGALPFTKAEDGDPRDVVVSNMLQPFRSSSPPAVSLAR
jgi:hypothetical protein